MTATGVTQLGATEPAVGRGRRWWVIVSTVLSVALLLAVIAVAAVYWPSRFGGSHAVVRVSGQSMEPTLRSGDIVIVRALDEYALGDIIVYPGRDETGEVRGHVIHRVVAGDAVNGYVTRGDNRTSDDVWRPTPAEIEGAVVRTLASGSVLGSLVSVLTRPLGLALIAGGLVFIAVWRLTARHSTRDVGAGSRRRRRGPVDGIPYGWVPAPPVPPLSVVAPAAPAAPPAAVDLAALGRVAAPSVVAPSPATPAPTPSVTAATVAELLMSRLQAEMATLDELEVRWAHEDEPADWHDARPVATIT